MRLRVEYSVGPDLKFLANLDMMHLMERALRRAEIPCHLSEGFNPHIRLSMGTILPVGVWGKHEYFDLELAEMDPQEFMFGMNAVLPPAMIISDCRPIADQVASLMKVVNAADYTFILKSGLNLQEMISDLLSRDSLLVQSRGKNKNVQKQLRPGLYGMKIEKMEEQDLLTVMVSINDPVNIRYDELLALFIENGVNHVDIVDIYRQGNYIKAGRDFYSPLKKV